MLFPANRRRGKTIKPALRAVFGRPKTHIRGQFSGTEVRCYDVNWYSAEAQDDCHAQSQTRT